MNWPRVRKGYGPPTAILIETRRAAHPDYWGQLVPVEEVLAATVVIPTGEHLPAMLEAGTNGTEAVEPMVYDDEDGDRFYTMGGGLWTHVDDDGKFFHELSYRSPETRYVFDGRPITGRQLIDLAGGPYGRHVVTALEKAGLA